MRALQFLAFVIVCSVIFSALGIMLAVLALRLKDFALAQSAVPLHSLFRVGITNRLARMMVLTHSLETTNARVAVRAVGVSVVFILTLASIGVSVYRSLTLQQELQSSSLLLRTTYDSVRDHYVPSALGEGTISEPMKFDLPISSMAKNLAMQADRGVVSLKADDYRSFGVLAYQEGRYDDAIRYFDASLELNSSDYRNLTSLGVTYFQKGEQAKNQKEKMAWNTRAITAYKRAIAIDPAYVVAHSNLGISLFVSGHEEEGIAEEQKAIEVDPNYPVSYYNLACAYSLRNEREVSLRWLVEAVDRGYDNLTEMKNDPTLANIRDTPEYKRLEQRLEAKELRR